MEALHAPNLNWRQFTHKITLISLDQELIIGNFLYEGIPHEKAYLRKYFPGKIKSRFLVYYLTFKRMLDFRNARHFCRSFVDHTGIYCTEQWLYILLNRVIDLEARVAQATREVDFETLSLIKAGKYEIQGLAQSGRINKKS